jgi:membrane peptidoglycan carboxypeptidase
VYVPLAIEVGRERIKKMMLDSGVVADEENFFTNISSFGLGPSANVTPLSMANAFGTLMNHGVHMKPRYVRETRNADGAVVEQAPDKPKPVRRAMPADVADRVVEAMSGVTEPGGTAVAARQEFTVYGKTGTTNDSTDAWFIGCAASPQNLCLAVWMGYEDQNCKGVQGRSCGGMKNVNGVKQVYGGTLPAKIFDRSFEILREIQANKARGVPNKPIPSLAPAAPADPVPTPRKRRRATQAPAPAPPQPAPAQSPPAEEPEPEPEPEPSEQGPIPPPPDADPSPGGEPPPG